MPFFALAVPPLAALVWWFVSFRGGRYDFINVLMGSALLALILMLPLFLALALAPATDGYQTGSYGFDPATLALGFVMRTPVYLLVSIIVIRITLALSKATAVVLARVRPAGSSQSAAL
jgi:hypothetical protein